VKAVLVLLEHKADVNAKETDCYAPLHLAARRGLPEGRANANVRTKDGRTPLHSAASAEVKGKALDIISVLNCQLKYDLPGSKHTRSCSALNCTKQ
jgi:ankyrin repeat protein